MDQGYPNGEKILHKQTGWIHGLPIFRIVFGLLVLMFGIVGVFKWLTPPPAPPPALTYPNGVVVITGIQQIGKLETVSNTIQQIIKYDPNGDSFWNFINDPKKLFVVYGTVVAGIDLSTITTNDVIIKKSGSTHASVTLNLPAPQVFSTTIDPSRTIIYDISGGLLAPLDQNMDPNLVEQILAGAKVKQQTEACNDNHILKQASDSAQTQLTSFLKTLGFTSAIVNIAPGTCS